LYEDSWQRCAQPPPTNYAGMRQRKWQAARILGEGIGSPAAAPSMGWTNSDTGGSGIVGSPVAFVVVEGGGNSQTQRSRYRSHSCWCTLGWRHAEHEFTEESEHHLAFNSKKGERVVL
jgi:hypothetical protein